MSFEEKSLAVIRETIRQERLSAIRIVIYNYEEHLAGREDEEDNFNEDEYSDYDSEEQEKYVRELYGSYDDTGYSNRDNYSEDTNGYTYKAKIEAQEAKAKLKKYISDFEVKNNCKVIYRLTSIKREGEIAIIFRGFR